MRLTSITFSVIWSSVLISVTRKWRYSGLFYKFFLIKIVPYLSKINKIFLVAKTVWLVMGVLKLHFEALAYVFSHFHALAHVVILVSSAFIFQRFAEVLHSVFVRR